MLYSLNPAHFMKTTTRLCSFFGFFLLTLILARGDEPAPLPAGYTPLKIDQTWQPMFPQQATAIGFSTGEAHVVINVDANGALADWLVVGYSHPSFADQAMNAIKKWKFEPARWQGEPVPVVVRVDFNFERQGLTIVTQSPQENLQERFLELDKDQYAYRVHLLQELDHIPRPVHIVEPIYPADWANRGITGIVNIEFYIDEAGKVRLPAVESRGVSPLLGNLALTAVQQWQFEPATCKGKPVLVRASQSFNFGTKAAKP